jgi:hypothetical protein
MGLGLVEHTDEPALVRRQLGRHLRRLRIAAGKTHGDAEIASMGHRSTMWRIEAGRARVRPSTVRALCWLYGADEATSDALYAMAIRAEQPGWWEEFRDNLPGWFTLYVELEAAAQRISTYQPSVVDGLLQTPDYARAVFEAGYPRLSAAQVQQKVQIRLQRQQQLLARENPVHLNLVLGEAAMVWAIGGPEVLAAQREHLRALNQRGNIDVRVVTFASGAHPATGGRVTILDLDSEVDPDVVYLEMLNGGRYLETASELALYRLKSERTAASLTTRTMSDLMLDFLCDLAGHDVARSWATGVLADPGGPRDGHTDDGAASSASDQARSNAFAILRRIPSDPDAPVPAPETARRNLARMDLRGQDLTGQDLTGADLREADLRGLRLSQVRLDGADLRDADLTGVRMSGGSLATFQLEGSQWRRAALLGVDGLDTLADSPALSEAAVTGRDRPDLVLQLAGAPAYCVEFSPQGDLLAVGRDRHVELLDQATGQVIRHLSGHTSPVRGVAFSPDGATLATTSHDRTARLWDTATGTCRTTLSGHTSRVLGVAFSPDGTTVATASTDRTARLWDAATGTVKVTLLPLEDGGYAVLLPDGSYKLSGDPGGAFWWAMKLCRFAPGELDDYVPQVRRLSADTPILRIGPPLPRPVPVSIRLPPDPAPAGRPRLSRWFRGER